MKYVLTLMFFASGLAHGLVCTNLPAGATALGYTSQVFYDEPNLTEVSTTDTDSTSKWYPGSFSNQLAHNLASRELLSMHDSELAIPLGSGIDGETHASKAGALPLLSGAKGFYVEIAMHLSSNDDDHFVGLFLQTAEHDIAKTDHYSPDPLKFERWTEIDIAESGYGPGVLQSVMNWSGYFPHYDPKVRNNYGLQSPLDWTVEHRYGVSYDPIENLVQWYVDDVPTYSISPPPNSVITKDHFYVVLEASSHGAQTPYDMYVRYVTAYTK